MIGVGQDEIKNVLFQEQQITEPLEAQIEAWKANGVKRADFNQYIARKDEEYHAQSTINLNVMKEMGELEGEIKEDDEVLGRVAGRYNDPPGQPKG